MDNCYIINQWIFTKIEDDSIGAYYCVTDNNGRTVTRSKKFYSVDEMKEFVRNNAGCGSF